MNTKSNHSHDVNELEIKPSKSYVDIIAPIAQIIFDVALKSGQFPTGMQLSKGT